MSFALPPAITTIAQHSITPSSAPKPVHPADMSRFEQALTAPSSTPSSDSHASMASSTDSKFNPSSVAIPETSKTPEISKTTEFRKKSAVPQTPTSKTLAPQAPKSMDGTQALSRLKGIIIPIGKIQLQSRMLSAMDHDWKNLAQK